MRILIAEDDPTSRLLLTKTLQSDGYEVEGVADGLAALDALRAGQFDAIVSDWMMPRLDGIGLVRRVRAEIESPPPILMVTALSSADARSHALEAGADDYLAKPYEPREVLRRLRNCISRALQPAPARVPQAPPQVILAPTPKTGKAGRTSDKKTAPSALSTDHVGVALVASTGGPEALRRVIESLDPTLPAAYFMVLHGPGWMLETFAERLNERSRLEVTLAQDHERIQPGRLLLCPGDVHMKVDATGGKIRLTTEPPENFVRPAADPLLRSLAASYGTRAIGVVMTGMGRDGSVGCQHLHAAGGTVLVQDPNTAVAASMPRTVVGLGIADDILPLEQVAAGIHQAIRTLATVAEPARR